MARYVVATHRALITRDWLCLACNAYGHVAVGAEGRGRRRVWVSREAAESEASDAAAMGVEPDADLIVSLVRCPKCHARPPHAMLGAAWRFLPELVVAAMCSGLLGALAAMEVWWVAGVLISLVVFGLLMMIGNERRRWKAAAGALVVVATTKRAPISEPAPPRLTGRTDPYREAPAPPPIAVARPAVQTATPVVVTDETSRPTFLN